jgi:hypothetical protein
MMLGPVAFTAESERSVACRECFLGNAPNFKIPLDTQAPVVLFMTEKATGWRLSHRGVFHAEIKSRFFSINVKSAEWIADHG